MSKLAKTKNVAFVNANSFKSWGNVKAYDNYLRGELKEQKENNILKTENNLYQSFHCQRDNFTRTAMSYMQIMKDKDPEILAKRFTISTSHEDEVKNGLTPKKMHEMSMEFAEKYFKDYPTLAVTHVDTNNLHTQFIVASVNVENGKCFHQSKNMLRDMKEDWGKILLKNGMTESVKAMEKAELERERAEQESKKQGKKVYPQQEKHKTMAERRINKRGEVTDRQFIGRYINKALDEERVPTFDGFKDELLKQGIVVEKRGSNFVFKYENRNGKEQHVRSDTLAKILEDDTLKREEIEKRIQENAEIEKKEFMDKSEAEKDSEYQKLRLISQHNGESLKLVHEVEKFDDKLLEAKQDQNKIDGINKSILSARDQHDNEREQRLVAEKEELVKAKDDIRRQLEDISIKYAEIERRINEINKELDKKYPDDPKIKQVTSAEKPKLNEREFKRVYGETNAQLEMSPTGARERVTEAGAEASNIQRSNQKAEETAQQNEKQKQRVVPHM